VTQPRVRVVLSLSVILTNQVITADNQAFIDPEDILNLPNVLLIGDFDSIGYTLQTHELLAGELETFGGYAGSDGNYHYHSSKTYPYISDGFHGEVSVRGGQMDPQPRDKAERPPPLVDR
jgi:hypothetical protein